MSKLPKQVIRAGIKAVIKKRASIEQLQASLPKIQSVKFENKELIDVEVAPLSFIRDGVLFISAENGDGAGDYYGEFRGGYPYINPTLETWAKENGGHFEWQNPGCFGFYKD